MPGLLTMKEAAEYMKVSHSTWKSWVAKRVIPNGTPIPIIQISKRKLFFDPGDLDKLLKRLKVVPMEKFKSVI